MNYPEVMTKEDLMNYLGLDSVEAVRNGCRAGEIPHIKIRREYKFFKKAIDEWLYSSSIASVNNTQTNDEVDSFEKYSQRRKSQ